MCYGQQRPFDETRPPSNRDLQYPAAAVVALRGRLAETEARLARARAREAELSRQLEEMKRFVLVMEIVEDFLGRRFHEQRDLAVARLLRRGSAPTTPSSHSSSSSSPSLSAIG